MTWLLIIRLHEPPQTELARKLAILRDAPILSRRELRQITHAPADIARTAADYAQWAHGTNRAQMTAAAARKPGADLAG